MSRGGARNRSGPQPDPKSLNTANRGLVFTALPVDGYDGEAPAFPLPGPTERELVVWVDAWRSPQAAAWAVAPWRHRAVALWVRWSVRMEAEEASAALGNVVVRFADQIGMTPAGLKENGWQISASPEADAETSGASTSSARGRLSVVPGGA